ncbi:MAG: TraY domain-containing protein [Clostridiales bacterium]|jgi:predicted DNA-binding protein|nr:TraY domain-containing protein [Clostridiales bacterium]
MDNILSRYTLRINRILLEKLGYIASSEGRTKNKEIEQLIKKRIAEYEQKYGAIDLNDEY